jgi:hypothetical protein
MGGAQEQAVDIEIQARNFVSSDPSSKDYLNKQSQVLCLPKSRKIPGAISSYRLQKLKGMV